MVSVGVWKWDDVDCNGTEYYYMCQGPPLVTSPQLTGTVHILL